MSTDNPSDGQDRTAELLSQALHEEAAMVDTDPAALQSIQQRTRTQGAVSRPRWAFGALGAAAATAAVITAVVVIGDSNGPSSGPDPANAPTKGTLSQQPPVELSLPISYVGEPSKDRAARLFTEQHSVQVHGTEAESAVEEFLSALPADPDYANGMPAGLHSGGMSSAGGVTTIGLKGPENADLPADPSLGPNGGDLAMQALFRTAGMQPGDQAAVTYNGDSLSTMLGVALPATVKPDDEVRALVSVDSVDYSDAADSPVTVTVSGNTFEGNVNWQLFGPNGKVDEGYATTSMGSWTQAKIKLGNLSAGSYRIECLEYSPENGKPGNVDDKTFTVS